MASTKVQLAQNKLLGVLATYKGDRDVIQYAVIGERGRVGWRDRNSPGLITLVMDKCPIDFLEHLLENSGELTPRQFATIFSFTSGDEGIGWTNELSHPKDVQAFVSGLGTEEQNCEVLINGRWYPVTLESSYDVLDGWGPVTTIRWSGQVCHETISGGAYATKDTFKDEEMTLTAEQLMARFNIRELETDLDTYNELLMSAQLTQESTGHVMRCVGSAMYVSPAIGWGFSRMTSIRLGDDNIVSKVVIDKELEGPSSQDVYSGRSHRQTSGDPLPFVRAFSLETKRWVFIDTRDLRDHQYDEHAIDRLVLPTEMLAVLKPLFAKEADQLFGDLITGKHGGMIILANGPSGTGKTLTAEVFAERTHRPLYVMEMFELGLDLKEVEKNLDLIFRRVTRWNAVLLMDECDIFLSERDSNLEHNVMVGIFLRLMDYYKGLLFMTSNRGEAIDDAFKSRITLKLDYPALDRAARELVWGFMLEAAGIRVTDGLDGVPDIELNGRQIRNLVRLIRVLHGNQATNEQMKNIVRFACR